MNETIRNELNDALNNARHGLSCTIWTGDYSTALCSCGAFADAILAEFTVTRRSGDHAALIAKAIEWLDSTPDADLGDPRYSGYWVDDLVQSLVEALEAASK